MATKNIMIVGVGGQGTLLTSRILGGLAIASGYDVKLSEVHGMAQRGGSVVTFVRYGEKVKEYEEFLNSLRELGVVHIVEKQQGAADNTELQENIRLSNRLAATLKLLQNQKHEKNAVIATEGGTAARGMQVLDEVDALQTEHGKLSQQLQSYAKEKEALEAWGNFEPDNVQKLKDAGYVIGFYSCSEGNYKEEWETVILIGCRQCEHIRKTGDQRSQLPQKF